MRIMLPNLAEKLPRIMFFGRGSSRDGAPLTVLAEKLPRIMLPRIMFLGRGSTRDGAPGTNLAKKGDDHAIAIRAPKKTLAAVIP